MEDSVNILKFAECRAKEIMTLKEEITLKEPKLSVQKLPFHMRRRAASHNIKRIPKSIKLKVPIENLAKHKKKSKSHKSLLEEYNNRQRCYTWLPTHIWLAKRFHMKKMWCYQLPFQATGKRFRSSYRATVKNVLLQDLSYFCCIELRGQQEQLLSQLSCLTDESVGMNFAAESCIDGTKEGQCFIYHPNTFPLCAVGPVTFLWKPCVDLLPIENESPISSRRQLWIWCHPSIVDELIEIFVELFHLQKSLLEIPKQYTFASHVNYMKCKLHFQTEPVYRSDDIIMYVLKDTLVRHRILGPNALSILTSILKPVKSTIHQSLNFPETQQLWEYLSGHHTAYLFPIKSVIGVRVEDPRLHVTSKRENVLSIDSECKEDTLDMLVKPSTAFSELWDMDIRNEATVSQVPEHILNKEREKYVICDASDIKKFTTSVPILLIHQPGINGYASGWDIIAPQGWGMAFWIPFVYHGAQPSGFDDFCSINMESGFPTFPLSFPDTKAGFAYEEQSRVEKLKKFYRYSKAKRPNFKILGVSSPFFMPWKLLVNEWKQEFSKKYNNSATNIINGDDEYFTLRAKNEILCLQNFCHLLQKSSSKETMVHMYNNIVENVITHQNIHLKALLLVRVRCLFRGTPTNGSNIYLPSEVDFQTIREDPKYFGPLETKHDVNAKLPVKEKREKAKQESKDLNRPEIETIISCCDRKIIGYVSEGGYSRLGSQGYGIGHCTLTGFLTLLELCLYYQSSNVIVLIREQHSFQYRPATVNILNNMF